MKNFILFSIPALIWGSTWLAIKYQLGVVDPLVSVSYRFLLAAIILFAYCSLTGMNLKYPVKQHFYIALQGLLLFGVNYWLVYLAEIHLESGLVAVLFSTIIEGYSWDVFAIIGVILITLGNFMILKRKRINLGK